MTYMTRLLEELGWARGIKVPLASKENEERQDLLLKQQEELKRLREANLRLDEKRADVKKYKETVLTETSENTRLLVAYKNHHDKELKLKNHLKSEENRLKGDLASAQKEIDEVKHQINFVQGDTARLIKRAETLGSDVCHERGVLEEWRLALESSADDIVALQKYTKEDGTVAKNLETRRQLLKGELDKAQKTLYDLVATLVAEENIRERLSLKIAEALRERQSLIDKWANAVENLRQRDEDIRRTKEDCELLRNEMEATAELVREKEEFLSRQRSDNVAAERSNRELAHELSLLRTKLNQLHEGNLLAVSQVQSLQNVATTMNKKIQELYRENKQTVKEIQRKEKILSEINKRIEELTEKKETYVEQEKSCQMRLKELEDIVAEEEKLLETLCTNQQRAMHCSFTTQQKLNVLIEWEKMFGMGVAGFKTTMNKLESEYEELEKELAGVKETYYQTDYAVMQVESEIERIKKEKEAVENDTVATEKVRLLRRALGAYRERAAALSTQMARLQRDMIVISTGLVKEQAMLEKMDGDVLNGQMYVEGEGAALRDLAAETRSIRVEEALLRLRVSQTQRALNVATNRSYELQAKKIDSETVMKERFVEIAAMREMLLIQKRAFTEDNNKIICQHRERTYRVDQLKKRHDILMATFGKRDDGKELSVTFFKIKYAQERAELQEKGDLLDAEMRKTEREVRALEAALRLVTNAHERFVNKMSMIKEDDPQILIMSTLNDELDKLQEIIASLTSELNKKKLAVEEVERLTAGLQEKFKKLDQARKEAKNAAQVAEAASTRMSERLRNSRKVANKVKKQAKEFMVGPTAELFKMELRTKDYDEAVYNAIRQLNAYMPDVARDNCGRFSIAL